MIPRRSLFLLVAVIAASHAPVAEADVKKRDTIKSLESKSVEIAPGGVIVNSSELARAGYRDFLDLVSADPELRAEALRRLGDLELEASEAEQLAEQVGSVAGFGEDSAVGLYQRLLEAYPDYRRNDTVLYQLARAYELGGRTDAALGVLDEIVASYPATPLIDEVQFRRGEMLFLRKRYADARAAYSEVVRHREASQFYEQSLYKLGWSQFKLAAHEDSFEAFFALLDRKIGALPVATDATEFPQLGRAERELVDDTLRVLSISFSYLDGAGSIDRFLDRRGRPGYTPVVYRHLGDLYLEKERFVDAAESYAAFVEQDPYHPRAPYMQVRVIEAYARGGFQSLVLDAKKEFVDRYGMDGEFWRRNARADHEALVGQLKANLNDLARHHHAAAQRGDSRDDYREAARWYRKYLEFFPGQPDSASTNFLLAEILYESERYPAATEEYERTAYDYPLHAQSGEAAYAAILAYRAHEDTLTGEERTGWHQRYLDSGIRFAATFPGHPQSGAVQTTIAEELFEENRFERAIEVARSLIARNPPVAEGLLRTAWTVTAHAHFDLGQFGAAELAYYELRSLTPAEDGQALQAIEERIASSIYKQGEMARDAGDGETAVAHFLRVGYAVPDAGIRATAEYDAAAALIGLEAWSRAVTVLERLQSVYPDNRFAADVTRKLAVSYLNSGRLAEAGREFERIANAPGADPETRREALWKSAELYAQRGAAAAEQRVLESLVERYPEPLAESIEARYRLLELAEAAGDNAARTERLQELVAADASAGAGRTERSRFLAATASLELADPVRERFERLELSQPLAESMRHKRAAMEAVIAAYTSAADYGVAEVTTAATYRLGEVYERLGADLMASERPADLDAEALEQYEILLEEQVFPFEEKAIDLYAANAGRTADGVYDAWVRKSFERLAGLMPARYAKAERSEDVVTSLY